MRVIAHCCKNLMSNSQLLFYSMKRIGPFDSVQYFMNMQIFAFLSYILLYPFHMRRMGNLFYEKALIRL